MKKTVEKKKKSNSDAPGEETIVEKTIHLQGGPMGAEITITRMGPPGDDDEEDDFIPPEIMQMI